MKTFFFLQELTNRIKVTKKPSYVRSFKQDLYLKEKWASVLENIPCKMERIIIPFNS